MINKKNMNYIRKETKKENPLIIKYFPTEDEIEYLRKYNIKVEKVVIKQKSLIFDTFYDTDYYQYTLNN